MFVFRRGRARSRRSTVTAGPHQISSRSPFSRWLTILFPALGALLCAQLAFAERAWPWLLGTPLGLLVALALWRDWRHARWAGALWMAGWGLERFVRLLHEGGALHAVVGVLFGWWALQVWRDWSPRGGGALDAGAGAEPSGRSRVPEHLVALLSRPPVADEAWVRAAFERAMPATPAHVHRHREGFFTIQWPGGAMALRVSERHVREEMAQLARSVRDPELARALREHEAALGVVPLLREGQGDARAIEAVIGRFLAELLGAGCVALGSNDGARAVRFHPELLPVLRTGALWQVLEARPPVVGGAAPVPGELAAVEEEARARFEEFAAAFARRKDDAALGPFWVKAAFAEGARVESLWIRVEAMDGESLLGLVSHAPLALRGLGCGEPVEVECGRIGDWFYLRSGEPQGFFGRRLLGVGAA
jgi:uncharacterized protein YegJ (DUF2314 family)